MQTTLRHEFPPSPIIGITSLLEDEALHQPMPGPVPKEMPVPATPGQAAKRCQPRPPPQRCQTKPAPPRCHPRPPPAPRCQTKPAPLKCQPNEMPDQSTEMTDQAAVDELPDLAAHDMPDLAAFDSV
ncbi:uncharacterized protein LOC135498368 [Lineus longissimus]|uniref:uncharacterized protein LOC135498368 n=1 Tax=Lineus longissimus TaxID=88925 RepID=UPI00315CFCC9